MSNRLASETSPYLREHAENPVDWYPWGEAAFEKAQREDKPVFLSIGYSTCHWCHVMAAESFENARVAEVLNKYYVAVKVDREERPDIDSVYMSVCTALTGSGGWPLNVIMTPEQQPFFAASYIPREDTNGQPGLITLLTAVAAKWCGERGELIKVGRDITALLNTPKKPGEASADADFLRRAAAQLTAVFDKEYGGFGTAPKFPSPHDLIFLLRSAALAGDRAARTMAEDTLKAMYKGGIFDHFGGGFSRYSTDREWLAPHFEKTLYDNALLAFVYTEAWQSGHMALYRYVAEATLDYCMRELLSPAGGYYCAQDADSRGEEGAYYLFTPEEVRSVLGEDAGRHFCECYDITPEGNFHGRSIPNLLLNTRWNLLPEGYDDFREKLRLYRAERMPLKTDEKVLTAWNGLMLMALSRAARAFSDARYLAAAEELAAFMAASLYDEHGALRASLTAGKPGGAAQLDDHVFYALGLVELYSADYDPAHLIRARALAAEVTAHFAAPGGGYYRTSDAAKALIARPQEVYDGALPSGSSGAAALFDALFRLTGDADMKSARDALLTFTCNYAANAPAGCAFALTALMGAVYPTREILCAAPDETEPELLRAVTARYAPELTVLLKTPSRAAALAEVAPFTVSAAAKDGRAGFYVCENGACREFS